jgi:RNA polymerase sigma-70 factor, ECF subfamily
VEQWPADGVPDNPRAWLVSAGRFKAIDKIRRRARFDHRSTTSPGNSPARIDIAEELDESARSRTTTCV